MQGQPTETPANEVTSEAHLQNRETALALGEKKDRQHHAANGTGISAKKTLRWPKGTRKDARHCKKQTLERLWREGPSCAAGGDVDLARPLRRTVEESHGAKQESRRVTGSPVLSTHPDRGSTRHTRPGVPRQPGQESSPHAHTYRRVREEDAAPVHSGKLLRHGRTKPRLCSNM